MVAIILRRYALAAGAVAAVATTSEAQSGRALVGTVKDSLGHAVAGAEVSARENAILAVSDDSGRFHVARMPIWAHSVSVRRLGFAPARATITQSAGEADSVHITLRAVAQSLPEMSVQEVHDSLSRRVLADFWARRKSGFG